MDLITELKELSKKWQNDGIPGIFHDRNEIPKLVTKLAEHTKDIEDIIKRWENVSNDNAALPLQSVTNRALLLKIKKLEADNKLLNFMVENGLGEEDIMNDITYPHEL